MIELVRIHVQILNTAKVRREVKPLGKTRFFQENFFHELNRKPSS